MGNNLGKDEQIDQVSTTVSSSSGAAGGRNYPIVQQPPGLPVAADAMDISIEKQRNYPGQTQYQERGTRKKNASPQTTVRQPQLHVEMSDESPSTAPAAGYSSIGEDSSSWGLGSAPEDETDIVKSTIQNLAQSQKPVPDPDDDLVPTVFRWEHGGRQVYVTGTFNNWQRQIPMHRSGNDFTYIHNLKKGKHAFKFVVDDEWRFAPDQATVADVEGRINNFIDVSDFDAYTGDDQFLLKRDKSVSSDMYARDIPDLDEYTKDPPPLPPHLRHIILNKAPPHGDPNALPPPQHVALNHLYCTAIKDGMMVLGVTLRYKHKSCTTVYYSAS